MVTAQEWALVARHTAPSVTCHPGTKMSTLEAPVQPLTRLLHISSPFPSFFDHKKKVKVLVAQSRPTLCNPMDYSPPSSSIHGISQTRILEWVAIPFSRRSSWPRGQTCASYIAGRFFTAWATRQAPNTWFYKIKVPLFVCTSHMCTDDQQPKQNTDFSPNIL